MLNKTLKFADIITFSRASSATYWDANGILQTAAAGEPRFDHDPVSGEGIGIIFEEQRTNLNPNSNLWNWTESNGSGLSPDTRFVEHDVAIAPDGTLTAARITASTGQDLQRIFKSLSASGTFIHSVHMKAGTSNYGAIKFTTGDTMVVDLTDGSVVTVPGSQSYGVEALSNGWYRLWIENFDTNSVCQVLLYDAVNESLTFAGEGESILVWGHQLEEGVRPTSYIPADGATATRSADIGFVDPITPWASNQPQMTLLANWKRSLSPSTSNLTFHSLKMGPAGPISGFFGFYSAMNLLVYTGDDPVEVKNFGVVAGQTAKTAFSISGDSVVAAVNGDSLVGAPGKSYGNVVSQTRLELASGDSSGWLQNVRYFPYAMTAEQLEEKTA